MPLARPHAGPRAARSSGRRRQREATSALIAFLSRQSHLHNTASIVHTDLSRDQPVPRKSKRESLHQIQGSPYAT